MLRIVGLGFLGLILLFVLSRAAGECESSTCLGCLNSIGLNATGLNTTECAWCPITESCTTLALGCPVQKIYNGTCPRARCRDLSLEECDMVVGCAKHSICYEIIPQACTNPNIDSLLGYWSQIDLSVGWCERLNFSTQEPFNTISASIMALIAIIYYIIAAILNNGTIVLVLHSYIVLNGLLSALGHTLAYVPFTSTDAQTMVIPITIAAAGMIDEVFEFTLGGLDNTKASVGRAVTILLTTIITSMALPALQAGAYLIFVITFGVGVLFVVIFQLVYLSIIAKRDPLSKSLRNICIFSTIFIALALLFWILDHIQVVCTVIPVGFHFLWHLFAAVALCNFVLLFSYQHANNCGYHTELVWIGKFIPGIKWNKISPP